MVIEPGLREFLDTPGLDGLPLYKIIPRKHLASFSTRGEVLLRRLLEYQCIECDGRRDEMEGLIEHELSSAEVMDPLNNTWPVEAYRNTVGINLDGQHGSVHADGGKVILDASHYLVYCLTSYPSPVTCPPKPSPFFMRVFS